MQYDTHDDKIFSFCSPFDNKTSLDKNPYTIFMLTQISASIGLQV